MSQHQRDKRAYMNATPMQREVVRRLLCDVLGCLRTQYLSYQTSHWQVVGQSFYGNHLLFARLYESVQKQVDELAEKLVGYLGREVVGLDHQIKHIAGYTMRWSKIDCHHKRGLQSEADLQAALKRAYDGIKQVNAMTLGLDDWIMATANAHEENEYLLQQALTPVPGRQASKAFRLTQKEISRADEVVDSQGNTLRYTIITRPQADGGVLVAAIDVDTGKPWGPTAPQVVKSPNRVDREITNILRWIDKMGWTSGMASSGRMRSKLASTNAERYFYKATDGKWYVENEEDWDTGGQVEGVVTHHGPFPSFEAAKRYMDRNFANLKKSPDSYSEDDSGRQRPPRNPVRRRFWGSSGKGRLASDAPTAEGDFYDNPEKKEVLEFANTGAISNSPEVAAAAAAEDQLDVSEAKAVSEAEGAPPTPEEIRDEPGGDAVSTLNRFVVETDDPAVAPAEKMNELRDRQARLRQAFSNWSSVSDSSRLAAVDKLVFKPGKGVVEWDHAKKTFSVEESDVEKILGELRGDIYLYSTPASKLYRFSLSPPRNSRYWKYTGPEGLTLLVWK